MHGIIIWINLAVTCATLGINVFVLIQCLLKNTVHHRYLAVFFMVSIVNYLDDIFWMFDGWRFLPTLTNAYIPFMLLMAPALFLYIKSLVIPNNSFQIVSKHWLGFVFGLILCLPYYLFDTETKLNRLMAAPGELEHLGIVTWGPTLALLAVIPFGLFYIMISLRLLKNNNHNIKLFFSNIENKTLSWIRWTLLILILAWLVSSIELILPTQVTETGIWSIGFTMFEMIWMIVFSLFALQQEHINIPISYKRNQQPINSKHIEKYKRSPLELNEIKRIINKLQEVTDKHNIHRESELSLHSLSKNISESVNKISQVLNIHLDTGFYDFINQKRINDACEQLKNTELNIIDIAYLVGFNSKSTFNKAFKKHIGITPSQFKAQN